MRFVIWFCYKAWIDILDLGVQKINNMGFVC